MIYNFDDEKIFYSGRWAPYAMAMTTTATGSYFEFKAKGEYVLLKFNMDYHVGPYPRLYISVDGKSLIESAVDSFIRIVLPDNDFHTIKVLFKSTLEGLNRWAFPIISKISLESIEAEEIAAPEPDNRKVIEFVGDSITEGVLTDPDLQNKYIIEPFNRATQDDVTTTYAYLTAKNLGLRSVHMGYGAVGVTKGGNGGVPKASESYPYCFNGQKVTYDHPDYILINHGANDTGASDEQYVKDYGALLDVIFNLHPNSKVIALTSFRYAHGDALKEFIKEYNEKNKKDILFVSSKDWVDFEPLHPTREGHKTIAEKLTNALKPYIK